jgi:hypothetical protein
LKPGSPCIGSGKDGTDMGAVPFTATQLFVRGDSNSSGKLDISDAVTTLDYLFRGGADVDCLDALDADDSGDLDITDAIFALQYLFQGGKSIPPPYPQPGVDPTPEDPLGCGG